MVSDENLELSFTHENNGKILEASSISVGVANDLKIVKFSLRLLEIFRFDCMYRKTLRCTASRYITKNILDKDLFYST